MASVPECVRKDWRYNYRKGPGFSLSVQMVEKRERVLLTKAK